MERLSLLVRAYDWILKVARTIADLEEKEHIGPEHVAEPSGTTAWGARPDDSTNEVGRGQISLGWPNACLLHLLRAVGPVGPST